MAAAKSKNSSLSRRIGSVLRKLILVIVGVVTAYLSICLLLLLSYIVVDPPVTGVQLQRQVEAVVHGAPYSRRYQPVSAEQISPHLKHAVIAAEDGRFYQHRGIDWQAVRDAAEETFSGTRRRGGSTISQQLVKNLFMTTHSNFIRKGFEVPLTYMAEFILGKERIIELYMNIAEWDDGVFGAEAAAQNYFGTSAQNLTRYQAAGLAACLPAPRSRSPQYMSSYTNTILVRMSQMGW